MTTPKAIAEAARLKLVERPELVETMREEWDKVLVTVAAVSAEFGHPAYAWRRLQEVARLEMLAQMVDGREPGECARSAIDLINADTNQRRR